MRMPSAMLLAEIRRCSIAIKGSETPAAPMVRKKNINQRGQIVGNVRKINPAIPPMPKMVKSRLVSSTFRNGGKLIFAMIN